MNFYVIGGDDGVELRDDVDYLDYYELHDHAGGYPEYADDELDYYEDGCDD